MANDQEFEKMKLTVQWYRNGANGTAIVFANDEPVATIMAGPRAEVTKRLGLLGLRPKRWMVVEWGAEATLERSK